MPGSCTYNSHTVYSHNINYKTRTPVHSSLVQLGSHCECTLCRGYKYLFQYYPFHFICYGTYKGWSSSKINKQKAKKKKQTNKQKTRKKTKTTNKTCTKCDARLQIEFLSMNMKSLKTDLSVNLFSILMPADVILI